MPKPAKSFAYFFHRTAARALQLEHDIIIHCSSKEYNVRVVDHYSCNCFKGEREHVAMEKVN
jgi:hypothetical protein